ncbi:hypothetical protein IL306_009650 [Fusarium sp. DS 682]|nr:hypothetical protein IL306_009650 [Fusarium sp. DS 682]
MPPPKKRHCVGKLDRDPNHDAVSDVEEYSDLKRETNTPVTFPRRLRRAPLRLSTISSSLRPKKAENVTQPVPNDEPAPSASSATRDICAGCGSESHRLNICMNAGLDDGLMKGCPWCNTLEHSLTNCPETKHDLAMQLEMIQMRANMPFFQRTRDWVKVVRAAVANGHNPPDSFPWTRQFTYTMQNSLSYLQRGLNKVGVNNRKGLPIDPDTKDWATVQRMFPGFEGS